MFSGHLFWTASLSGTGILSAVSAEHADSWSSSPSYPAHLLLGAARVPVIYTSASVTALLVVPENNDSGGKSGEGDGRGGGGATGSEIERVSECVCVCVCVRERERRGGVSQLCVCVRERGVSQLCV